MPPIAFVSALNYNHYEAHQCLVNFCKGGLKKLERER